jgi:tetratricopeptide (TPR) repeat protein
VRGIGLSIAVVLAMPLAWWAPQSPIALWRADEKLARGDVDGAVALYESIARHGLVGATRRAAMERAAAVWWSDRERPDRAAAWLRELASAATSGTERAWVLERLAPVVALDEALDAYDAAVTADPQRACELLALAADRASAGPLAVAQTRWDALRERCAARSAEAWLAEGDALLGAGHLDEAQDAYERVAGDVVLQQAASAGIGVCRTRRGEQGGAAVADAEARR